MACNGEQKMKGTFCADCEGRFGKNNLVYKDVYGNKHTISLVRYFFDDSMEDDKIKKYLQFLIPTTCVLTTDINTIQVLPVSEITEKLKGLVNVVYAD